MKKLFFGAGLLFAQLSLYAQSEIRYEVNFPNLVHHEAEITMHLNEIPSGPFEVRMSRSSPGRYATHEFGKNVYGLRVVDDKGNTLKVNRKRGDLFVIEGHAGKVKVSYTLYGNWIDGTYAGFDETHAHMNIPATFAYPVGMDSRARQVTFNYPANWGWKVATQLKPVDDRTYYAPNFQYFMDSPVEISAYKTASWQVKNPDGKVQTIHLMAHSSDTQEAVEKYAQQLKKMVQEQMAVWGEIPTFDYGHYYFIHDVHPEYAGDGMEHRNSTVIVQSTPKIEGYESMLLGTFSHEFFHAWNVERLRPKTLEPFQFAHSNVSDALWFAEGFTQYYGNLLLKRAGFRTLDQIAQTFGGMVNTVSTSPGAADYSPVESSQYAVFADAGVAIDQTNKANIFTSYYTYGAAVALSLDLELRANHKLTLDDYMKALWKKHGKPEIPYSIPDLEEALASLTKNPKFAADFFKKQVYGVEKADFSSLLQQAGLILRKAKPGEAFTGFGRLDFESGGGVLPVTLKGSPAYKAGLSAGAVLLAINNIEIKSQEDLQQQMAKYKPGEQIEVSYSYHRTKKSTVLTLTENPALEVVPIEKAGGVLHPSMEKFRNDWLNTKIN